MEAPQILYIDNSDRLSEINIGDLGIKIVRGAEVVKMNSTSYDEMKNATKVNLQIPQDDYHSDLSKYILVILHGNNYNADTFYRKCLDQIPVIVTSGGEEIDLYWRFNKNNQLHTFCALQKLKDHLIDFLSVWQESKFAIDLIPFHIFKYPNQLARFFATLDILIQGFLTIIGIVEYNSPWFWLDPNQQTVMPCPFNKELIKQNWDKIKINPCSWFQPAIQDLNMVFPFENNDQLKALLGMLPKSKQILFTQILIPPDKTESELVQLSKMVLNCSTYPDCFKSDPECTKLIDGEFLKNSYETYKRICQ